MGNNTQASGNGRLSSFNDHNNKLPELLSPAGDMACLKAAIAAGCDAIYAGGSLYGARAYAKNFSKEELLEAIFLCHLYEKKLYLTVNTLCTPSELSMLPEWLLPVYEAGLDGVIVQDFGVMQVLRRAFPSLKLHASTQMSVTGHRAMEALKAMGVSRVVPARELTIGELKEIRSHTDMELEVFLHGAMCYSYSGQCLFSSMLGGRSGNRGRCAGPCRQPYRTKGEKTPEYLLSLKDLCALEVLPKLLSVGIQSLKIEGRMKSPEYVAGVTAVYRKYLSLWNSGKEYRVESEDLELLKKLYLRTAISTGYLEQRNSSSMVTLDKPCYAGTDEEVLESVRSQYSDNFPKREIFFAIRLEPGKASECHAELREKDYITSVDITGDLVEKGVKSPLDEASVQKQFAKLGETPYVMRECITELKDAPFLPVKALNQLRRKTVEELTKKVSGHKSGDIILANLASDPSKITILQDSLQAKLTENDFTVNLKTEDQYRALPKNKGKILPIFDHLLAEKLRELPDNSVLALPEIMREEDSNILEKLDAFLDRHSEIAGLLIRNLEEAAYFEKRRREGLFYIMDASLYVWNEESIAFLQELFPFLSDKMLFTLPLERDQKELKQLAECPAMFLFPVYGRAPLMQTANCIRKTRGRCDHKPGFEKLKDRFGVEFPVEMHCSPCGNTIYNSVPLCLLPEKDAYIKGSLRRIDLTDESGEETKAVMEMAFASSNKALKGYNKENYTYGHWRKSAE